jgi:hypothetical protein
MELLLMERASSSFANYIATLKPKKINNLIYYKTLKADLTYLLSMPISSTIKSITGYLRKYIGIIRQDNTNLAFTIVNDPYNFLPDFEWSIDTIIKIHSYNRKNNIPKIRTTPVSSIDKIATLAADLNYEDAINYMGELAGAWILTCPIKVIGGGHKVSDV